MKAIHTLIIFVASNATAQAPFASYSKPNTKSVILTEEAALDGDGKFSSERVRSQVSREIAEQVNELGKPDFLDHIKADMVFIQNAGKMFPTINGEVINYKLAIRSSKVTENEVPFIRPRYLPFSLFTKVSGNYADAAAATTYDASGYFGAPLTFRFTPSFELTKSTATKNKLFAGINTDLRLLTIGDTATDKIETGFGTYGSVGLTYMGKGFVQDGND